MLHILSQAFFFFFSLFFNLSVIRFCQNIFLIFGQFAMKKDPTAVLKFGTAIAFHKSNNEYINSYRFKGRFLLTKYINQVVNIQFPAFCCYFFLFNIFLLIFFLYIDSIYTKNNTNKTIQKYIFNARKPKRTLLQCNQNVFFLLLNHSFIAKKFSAQCFVNQTYRFFTVLCYFSHSLWSVLYSYPTLWKFFKNNNIVISKNIVP